MEEPLFIPHAGTQLFAVLHAPEEPRPGGVGVVFCEPFAEEKLWAQRLLVSFARRLAASGYWVLRFDCRGHGDSGGESVEATVETRLEDIARAVGYFRERTKLRALGLHGLRLGGTLALLAASRGVDAAFLALWNPVLHGERYFGECLRSNVVTQMSTYKKVLTTREEMLRALRGGTPVNIDGYLISPGFYREITQIDLQGGAQASRRPVYVALVGKSAQAREARELASFAEALRAGGAAVELQQVREEPFWKETQWYVQASEPLFASTLRWIEAACAREGGGG